MSYQPPAPTTGEAWWVIATGIRYLPQGAAMLIGSFRSSVYTELPVQPLRAAILKGEGGPARPTVGAESIPVRDAGELIHVYLARRAGKARELNPR